MAISKTVRMNPQVVVKLHHLFEQVLIKNNNGTVRYTDGWSDNRVGEEFNLTSYAVAKLRKSLFGELGTDRKEHIDKDVPFIPIPRLVAMVLSLQKRVQFLEDELGINK